MSVSPVPEGHGTVTPYLVLGDLAGFIDFAKAAFDAEEIMRVPRADGGIMHAKLRVGDSFVMMGEAIPGRFDPIPAMLHLYVPDADAAHKRAMDAGAEVFMPVEDQFYGDRAGGVRDRWGNVWWLATHVADISDDEIKAKALEMKC